MIQVFLFILFVTCLCCPGRFHFTVWIQHDFLQAAMEHEALCESMKGGNRRGHLVFFSPGPDEGHSPARSGCPQVVGALSQRSTPHLPGSPSRATMAQSAEAAPQVAGLLFWAKSCLWQLSTQAPFQTCQLFFLPSVKLFPTSELSCLC